MRIDISSVFIKMYAKLNLGCGKHPLSGYWNIDRVPLEGVDMVWDLENTPLPLANNSVDEVRCEHILEHVTKFIPLMEDLYRVCIPGAFIIVKVPNYKYEQAYGDPTHVRFFNERTFSFFDENYEYGFYTKVKFRVKNMELRNTSKTQTKTTIKRIRRYIPFKRFFNIFLWNMFSEIYFELEVVK